MSSKKLFTSTDAGCYADSTHGHGHVRSRLAAELQNAGGPEDLVTSLQGEMPDDGGDENDAVTWLNDNVCAHVVFFEFYEGDLMLVCVCPDCGMVEGHAESCPAEV